MADQTPAKGRLIALEGASGAELTRSAKRFSRHFCGGKAAAGVSRWDASNIFYELRRGDPSIPRPSPQTLLLLYASDLVFRLRWEIRPALEEGQCVIAAPYVESAIAFGKASGLPRRWLVDLFQFAPKPEACYVVKGNKEASGGVGRPSEGYLEFCCATLSAGSPGWTSAELRSKFIAYLDALERRRGCQAVTEQLLAAAATDR